MSFKEFDSTEIEKNKKKYAAEIKERWGNTEAYKESEEKTASYDKQQWQTLNAQGSDLLKAFGDNRHLPPDSEKVQALVEKWQTYISVNFYNCTKEILSSLGKMYVGDERFQKNIDQYGTGTAAFLSKAIKHYCADERND